MCRVIALITAQSAVKNTMRVFAANARNTPAKLILITGQSMLISAIKYYF